MGMSSFTLIKEQIQEEIKAIEASNFLLHDRPDDASSYKGLDMILSYPYSDTWEFSTELKRINLDEERKKDILSGNGFIITDHLPIQKELKSEYGIFSPKYGQTLSDTNPFIDRYRCECGRTKSKVRNRMKCPFCGKEVKYVDDNFGYFGWIVLNDYYVIHPNLYKSIEFLIGTQRLINILDIVDEKDEDGHSITGKSKNKKKPYAKERGKNEPFYGIGMIEFKNRFKEICDYYLNISSNKAKKKEYYDDIMNNIDIIFTQSIPVFTTLLRPYEPDKKKLMYEGTNGIYYMISRYAKSINDNSLKIFRKLKTKNQLLFDLQMDWNKLYREIDNILSTKKGVVRLLSGGRFNFSSRDVIVQNPKLRIDQVTLPYWCLVDILQQQIINVLTKTYNMSYNEAYTRWYKANINPDDVIIEIIKGLMFSNPRGLPVIINRNPSINRGSLLQMFCVGMTFTYTMALPLQILPLLAADFDGDVLNVYYIINKPFYERALQILNPRNAMYISNNDGKLNKDVIPAKDTLINANTLVRLARNHYTPQELQMIQMAKNM